MWLFKTPQINSTNKDLFLLAHVFELLAWGSALVGLLLHSYFLALTLFAWGYCSFWIALTFIAFTKREVLRGRFPVTQAISTLGIFGVNQNVGKSRSYVVIGIVSYLLMIGTFIFFWQLFLGDLVNYDASFNRSPFSY